MRRALPLIAAVIVLRCGVGLGAQGRTTDYPDADINFAIRLSELTKTLGINVILYALSH